MKKTMLVKPMYLVVAVACLFCGSLWAMPVSAKEIINYEMKTSPEGEWNYTVEGTPYEYSKGVLKVVKTNGEYEITVKVNYNSIEAEQVTVKGNNLDFVVYIEGQNVKVNLTIDGDKISGKAVSPEGVFPMQGNRSIAD